MSGSGIWWVGLTLLVLAVFPFLLYVFFSLVVLERKSQGLIDDLKSSKAFEIQSVKDQSVNEDTVRNTMRNRYGYKRFLWPVTLLVVLNLVGFSILWDIINIHFYVPSAVVGFLHPRIFLIAAELSMMAFLGVTVLNYATMLRRLFLWDLTTQVFWNAMQRTWTAVIVASVLATSSAFLLPAVTEDKTKSISAHILFFGVGFITNDLILWIIDRTRSYFQIQRAAVIELPLSLIQGVNIWHENRLDEEGVENVQNLATCDIIDLAIATRYELRTLLDWVDQAILIHRMGQKATDLRDKGFISGAIDMAWGSPENSNGDTKLSEQIAKTLNVEAIYVSTLMNSLYEDEQVRNLWILWQSDLKTIEQKPPVAQDKPPTT